MKNLAQVVSTVVLTLFVFVTAIAQGTSSIDYIGQIAIGMSNNNKIEVKKSHNEFGKTGLVVGEIVQEAIGSFHHNEIKIGGEKSNVIVDSIHQRAFGHSVKNSIEIGSDVRETGVVIGGSIIQDNLSRKGSSINIGTGVAK